MKLLFFSLLIVSASCFYISEKDNTKDKIVGGIYVPISRAPYQAQLLQLGNAICGAVILSEIWFGSAGHCFENTYGLTIITGSSYRSRGIQHQIAQIIVHHAYNSDTNDNDIALIRITHALLFNKNQKPIPISYTDPQAGDVVVISGFGKEGDHKPASIALKMTTVHVVDQRVCAKRYVNDPITNNMFCAGLDNSDACQGDSGGPAVINNTLAGIVSSGMDCGSVYYPGIYTRVNKYYDWIMKIIESKH